MREIRLALLEADVSFKVVKNFHRAGHGARSRAEVLESSDSRANDRKDRQSELTNLMGSENRKLDLSSNPAVLMLVGLQGAGKTTSGAKLAAYLKKKNGRRPLLAACEYYRPAAIAQLETLGRQLDIPVFPPGT
jgi:signal recognition particle subunit SRP54